MVDTSLEKAKQLYETEDPIKSLKSEYFLPEGCLYFSAHQLGPCSKRVRNVTFERLEQWKVSAN